MGGECNRVELAPSCLRDRAGARDLMTYSAVRRALGLTAAVENKVLSRKRGTEEYNLNCAL